MNSEEFVRVGMRNNLLIDKSIAFAARILKLHSYLVSGREYVISKQIVRSGTSIGANINEGHMVRVLRILYQRGNYDKYRTNRIWLLGDECCTEHHAVP
ncbi:MAG: four helix bundle protein [Anaerolineaceae bacterium]|nr:four helix bundle protein [Anaerolineaceae bacterium]